MKQFFLTLIIALSAQLYAQVPEPSEEWIMDDVEVPEVAEDNDNASYFIKNGKYGFINPAGAYQEAVYDKISFTSIGFIVKKGDFFGITDKNGTALSGLEYDSIGYYPKTYLLKKNGKYGTMTTDGKLVLPIKYKSILGGNEAVSFIKNKENEVQLVFNETGIVFPQKIEYTEVYGNLAIVKSEGKFGVIKKDVVIPFKYDSIAYSISKSPGAVRKMRKNDLFVIENRNLNKTINDVILYKNGKLGLASSSGSIIYSADNESINKVDFHNYYLIKKDNLNSIYFVLGKNKTEFEFESVYADGAGYVMAVKNNKTGVFNLQGKEIIPFEYDQRSVRRLSGIGFKVSKNKKQGIIDTKGNLIVPAIYDDIDTFYENGFEQFFKVKSNGKFGIINFSGEIIIPLEFDWIGTEHTIFKVVTPDPNRRFGLYDQKGKMIVPAEYQFINNTDTERSRIIILKRDDNAYNFLNSKNELIFKEDISSFGYVTDENNLLNPFSATKHKLLYVKNKKGKFGMLNETTEILAAPMVYDSIMQRFESNEHSYYSVKKGKKYGLINEINTKVIPVKYKGIDLHLISAELNSENNESYLVVLAKGKKFGAVNLKNEIQIPFKYVDLERISPVGLYKAKTGKQFQIIDSNNIPISTELFDEVANFERMDRLAYSNQLQYQALTFLDGKMRVMDYKGKFITSSIEMQPHIGYRGFDELKLALIQALKSPENDLLMDFVEKIVPSKHLLYYLKSNIFNKESLIYTNIPYIKEKYYTDLLKFKYQYWNEKESWGYNRASLTDVADYTYYRDGFITNTRFTDHAFGDTKYLEKFLRNAIKINGFWISSYFMKRRF